MASWPPKTRLVFCIHSVLFTWFVQKHSVYDSGVSISSFFYCCQPKHLYSFYNIKERKTCYSQEKTAEGVAGATPSAAPTLKVPLKQFTALLRKASIDRLEVAVIMLCVEWMEKQKSQLENNSHWSYPGMM